MKYGLISHALRNWKIYSEQGRYAISNYASEASPTLGCSIEISWDIVCVYVGLSMFVWETHTKLCMPKCVGGITWSKHMHAQSQFWEI